MGLVFRAVADGAAMAWGPVAMPPAARHALLIVLGDQAVPDSDTGFLVVRCNGDVDKSHYLREGGAPPAGWPAGLVLGTFLGIAAGQQCQSAFAVDWYGLSLPTVLTLPRGAQTFIGAGDAMQVAQGGIAAGAYLAGPVLSLEVLTPNVPLMAGSVVEVWAV